MRNARTILWSLAAVCGVASCAHGVNAVHQAPSPQSSLAPEVSPQPRSSVVAPALPPSPTAPVITPTPGASPANATVPAAPQITKKVPRVSPDTSPRILAVAISETTVAPGDHVSGRVVTTSNVASVQARIGGYAVNLSKVGVGQFALTYTVGPLPWFVRGNFTMQVIAKNARGDEATRAIPLVVR